MVARGGYEGKGYCLVFILTTGCIIWLIVQKTRREGDVNNAEKRGRSHVLTGSKIRDNLEGTGEGNGTPLQFSCLENPRGGGAWWAAVYGVAQSRT